MRGMTFIPIRRTLLGALLLVLAGAPARGADGVEARVLQILEEWRGQDAASEAPVEPGLVACGAAAVPFLCALLEDPQQRLPAVAMAGALGTLGDRRGIPTLGSMTSWSDAKVALRAVDSLTRIAQAPCVPLLLDALDDARYPVRKQAQEGLQVVHEKQPGLRVVKKTLARIPSAEHKLEAAMLVSRLGGEEARAGLLRLLVVAGDATTLAALDGLRPLCEPEDGLTLLLLLRRNASVAVRRKCTSLLGQLQHKPATRALMDLMAEAGPGLAADTHWALRQITGLRIKADPDLWEQWWTRGGEEASGPQNE